MFGGKYIPPSISSGCFCFFSLSFFNFKLNLSANIRECMFTSNDNVSGSHDTSIVIAAFVGYVFDPVVWFV